jgi:Ca-activated chloride channel homolog
MRPLLLCVLASAGVGGAEAQERPPALVVPVQNSQGQTEYKAIALEKVEASVRVTGFVAETRLTMTFANAMDRQLEGELYFPIPPGSTVSGYALDVGGVLVDGVVVDKEKARVVFEAEVRKGVDPGLVEWTQGNTFKTRVYPIPAKGTRTVSVRFVTELEITSAGSTYRLPLNFTDKLGQFSLTIDIGGARQAPKVIWPGAGGIQLVKSADGFTAQTQVRGERLVGELALTFAAADLERALVEKTPAGEVFFAIQDVLPLPVEAVDAKLKPISRVTLLWDASSSRAKADHAKELALVKAFFAARADSRVDVDLVVFRDAAAPAVHFTIGRDNVDLLVKALGEVVYDGGTQLAAITPTAGARVPDFYWLFSDGLASFGKSEPTGFKAPVHAVSAQASVNDIFLRWLAESTGGVYTDLLHGSSEAALQAIGAAPLAVISIQSADGKLDDVLPRAGKPVGQKLLVTGRLGSGAATVTVQLGVRGRVTVSREYRLSAAKPLLGDLLARLWAQAKVGVLAAFPKQNERALVDLGKRYNLVTPGTSLLVLERLEQYVEHQIAPPAALTTMRAEYDRLVSQQATQAKAQDEAKLEHILEVWAERVDWWSKKYKYPEGFKYGKGGAEDGRAADDDGDINADAHGASTGQALQSLAPSASSDNAAAAPMLEPPAAARRSLAKDGAAEDSKKTASLGGSGAETVPIPEPGIELKAWDPDTPYLRAMKGAAKTDVFKVYVAQKEEYGASPAFYLDCAEFFFTRGQKDLAIEVLSNIAELELEEAALLRVVAYRLQQAQELELAVTLFEEVLRLRPEEPQSYRDLALALADQRKYARALELLAKVVMNQWARFDGIEVVALMELNAIVPKAKAAGVQKIPLDPRLLKLLDLDVRISLGWDADLTDIDLWVIEPSGEKVAYDHQQSVIGGLVSTDFTQGYGPEEYVLKRAIPGNYTVKANFFGSSAQSLQGAVTLRLELITNFGRPNEKRRSTTIRLTESKETFTVGTLKL